MPTIRGPLVSKVNTWIKEQIFGAGIRLNDFSLRMDSSVNAISGKTVITLYVTPPGGPERKFHEVEG